MKVLLLSVFTLYVVAGQDINSMKGLPKYDSRYDSYLEVDAVLDSKRLVKNYVECLINQQRCTPEGKALKRILPEALRTKCVRCTERQKKTAVKVIKRIKQEYPDEWAKLASRWDPTGDFTRYFEEFLAKDNFNTIIYGSGNEIPDSTSSILPPAPTATTTPPAPADTSTPPRPIILNRFGEEGELMMGSPSSAAVTPPPTMRPSPTTVPPVPPVITTSTMRPVMTNRPTPTSWLGAASDDMPSRFPQRPFVSPTYTTAITFIDQIGFKIIRTTELVTDILKNTVRAVVGR